MPRPRTYMDFTNYEVKIIKILYEVYKYHNGNININLKDYMPFIKENVIITNFNKLNDIRIFLEVALISKYLFKIYINGNEIDLIKSIIRFR